MTNLAPQPLAQFEHITDWVFDLDNTLYPRSCNLFAQIDSLITRYVMEHMALEFEAAREIQKAYYREHGTTLNGLIVNHGIDPDHYLDFVHAIDYSPVAAHPELVEAIRMLPGRKFIFTNADVGHAQSVLKRLGGEDLFVDMIDIRGTGFTPKPEQAAYEAMLKRFGIDPARAVMFDDLEKNLKVPHEIGMATVHVVAEEGFTHEQVDAWELTRVDGLPHIHHVTSDLAGFLRVLF